MSKENGPIKANLSTLEKNKITAVNLYIECCDINDVPVFEYTLNNIEKWDANKNRYGGDIPYSAYILLARLMHPDLFQSLQEEKKDTEFKLTKDIIDTMAEIIARKNAKPEDV